MTQDLKLYPGPGVLKEIVFPRKTSTVGITVMTPGCREQRRKWCCVVRAAIFMGGRGVGNKNRT